MSLRRRLLLAYLGPLVVTMAASALVYDAFRNSVAGQQAVLESTQIMTAGQRLLTLVIDAETGARGFMLSGTDAFLEPYVRANQAFERQALELRTLVARDPEQLERAERMAAIYHEWHTVVAEPRLALRRGTTVEAISKVVADGEGKRRIDALRVVAEALIEREQRRLLTRHAQSERATAQAARMALLAPGVAVMVALLIGLTLARRIARSVESVAAAAEGIAAGDLNQRAQVVGNDEIARMARAFNTMSDWLGSRSREINGLRRLGEMLHACNDSDEAYRIMAALAPQLFPDTSGAVWSLHASRSHMSLVAAWGELDEAAWGAPFAPEDCWALRGGKPYLVQKAGVEIRCAHTPEQATAALCLPLIAHGDTLGIVQIVAPGVEVGRGLQSLAESAAEHLALALANLRLRESLRQQSIRDPLTGLFNRRYLEETMLRELARSKRSGGKLGILFIDVDHFKRLNDTEGHEAGDGVLRKLGEVIGACFRSSDVACRYGGEEFAIVMPDISLEHLRKRAEVLRESTQRMTVVVNGKMLGAVTISIGGALYPEHGENSAALLHNADQALYTAKREGRNRVALAVGPSTPPPAATSVS